LLDRPVSRGFRRRSHLEYDRFQGPIIALVAGLFVYGTLRLLGFASLDEIRQESVEQNNPTPAIVFVGTLIASILFLMLIIRP
jgi:hypothetical protein